MICNFKLTHYNLFQRKDHSCSRFEFRYWILCQKPQKRAFDTETTVNVGSSIGYMTELRGELIQTPVIVHVTFRVSTGLLSSFFSIKSKRYPQDVDSTSLLNVQKTSIRAQNKGFSYCWCPGDSSHRVQNESHFRYIFNLYYRCPKDSFLWFILKFSIPYFKTILTPKYVNTGSRFNYGNPL